MDEGTPRGAVPAIRMRVPANLYAYLEILAHDTMLGDTVNEVAEYVLKRRLEEMRSENYEKTHAIHISTGSTSQSDP
jgi:hypothetical protein